MQFALVERRDLSCKFVSKNPLIVLRIVHVNIYKRKLDLHNLFEITAVADLVSHCILHRDNAVANIQLKGL